MKSGKNKQTKMGLMTKMEMEWPACLGKISQKTASGRPWEERGTNQMVWKGQRT